MREGEGTEESIGEEKAGRELVSKVVLRSVGRICFLFRRFRRWASPSAHPGAEGGWIFVRRTFSQRFN